MNTEREKEGKISFDDFYQTYFQNVVWYINKKISNYHEAEDLAGEVFLYCYKHYEDYDPEKSALSTWLYLVVNSRIKNHYRDSKAHVDLEEVVGVLEADYVDMEKGIYLQQVKQILESAIAQLPEKQRQIVIMRYFEEKSSSDIAKKLGMTAINVRVTLSRALKALENLCGDLVEGVE